MGLGGGGIGLPGLGVSSRVNPAALAASEDTRVLAPNVQLSGQGPLNRDILDNLIEYRDFDHLEEIGIELVDRRNSLWTDLGLAVRHRHLEIGFSATGRLVGSPNEPLARWARQGHFGIPPPDARFHVGLGYLASMPVTYAWRFSENQWKKTPLEVGVRLVPAIGRYEKEVLQVNRSGDILNKTTAQEDGFSVGLDLGLRYQMATRRPLSLGLVARGLTQAGTGRYRQGQGLDLGVAYKPDESLTLVSDLMSLADRRRPVRFSVGAERSISRDVVLRGAVTTRGLAVGFDYRGLSFAYAADGESLLGTSFAF